MSIMKQLHEEQQAAVLASIEKFYARTGRWPTFEDLFEINDEDYSAQVVTESIFALRRQGKVYAGDGRWGLPEPEDTDDSVTSSKRAEDIFRDADKVRAQLEAVRVSMAEKDAKIARLEEERDMDTMRGQLEAVRVSMAQKDALIKELTDERDHWYSFAQEVSTRKDHQIAGLKLEVEHWKYQSQLHEAIIKNGR